MMMSSLYVNLVLQDTSSGEHKFKVVAVIVSEGSATNGFYSKDQFAHAVDEGTWNHF